MERANDKMLNYALMAFFGLLILIMVFQWWKAPSYTLSSDEVQQVISEKGKMILPEELKSMMDDGTIKQYTLVKLGENTDNGISGFGKTIRIPLADLLDHDNLQLLKNEQSLILIADFESESMMAMHLLTAKGFKNIRAVSNNLAFFKSSIQNNYKPGFAASHTEKARWDYARFFRSESTGGMPKTGSPGPQIPGAPKVIKAGGGC
jgi:hypothetical protein